MAAGAPPRKRPRSPRRPALVAARGPAVNAPETVRGTPPVQRSAGQFLTGAASNLTLAQCARLLTGLLWLGWADWWSGMSTASGASVISMIQTAAAVGIMAGAVLIRSDAGTRRFDAALVFGTLVMIALVGIDAGTSTGYGTDELAYDQSAAAGLLHGVNPYTTDFSPTLHAFGVFGGGTMTLHGTVVPSIAYPSLSFLLYVPGVLLLGDQSYAGLIIDVLAWVGAGAILWRFLSPALRPWVPLLIAVPVLFQAIVGGMTDPLFLPFELVAVCCWDRFADPEERSIARWIGPVALGLACCIKQPPWLIAPFLLGGVAFEAHRRGQDWRRVALRYVALAGVAFIVPNIPFILWNPGAWLSRILLPLTGALVPMGIGPAGLLRAYSIGGGNLPMFGLASAAAMIAMLVLFARHYSLLRKAIPLLPLVVLYVSSRNLGTYFAFVVPAVAINAASLSTSSARMVSSRLNRPLAAGAALAGLATVGFLGAALAWPAPTRATVTSSHATAASLFATVTVTNRSDRAVTPHFILAKGSFYQQPMQVVDGPTSLPPHSTTTVDLQTQLYFLTPHTGDPFQVQVATVSPDSFASSPVIKVGPSR
jgi:uncharacterized membrane protein